jgi:hypothetical protein
MPDCLVAVIQRALAKQKEERFRSGEEMAAALRVCAATGFGGVVDVSL